MGSDDLWPKLEAKFDRILAEHEALRTTNRELSAKNQELIRDIRSLRKRLIDAERRAGKPPKAGRDSPKRSPGDD